MAVTSQMRSLIDKYGTENEYVFPIISDDYSSGYKQYRLALGRINRHLKKIASMVGIIVPLTTYTARHTWLRSPVTMVPQFLQLVPGLDILRKK